MLAILKNAYSNYTDGNINKQYSANIEKKIKELLIMGEFLHWRKGDWGAFFGLLANNLTNFFTLAGLLIYTVGFPASFVYKNVMPGFGLAIFVAKVVGIW